MPESLTHKTIHGLKWSYTSTIVRAVMQIGYTAVMARLLNPSDFGLVAMSWVVLRFGNYFAQMGMSSALIQKKDLSNKNISAAFTSSLFLGLLFTILTFFLAPLAKYIFENSDVVPIVRIMGLSFLINGFSLTALALIRRRMNFKYLAFAEITAFVIGYLVIGIGSALMGFGVWSLVYASLVQSFILALLSLLIFRHNLSLTFSWINYKPLVSFGSKVSVISFLEFIGGSLDTVLIGRFFGDTKLGFYNRAQLLIGLPMNYLTTSFSRVLFPSFSQIQEDNDRIKKNILIILEIAASVLFPFAIFVSITSKEIVYIVLGVKWMESAVLLKVLSLAAAVDLLLHLLASLFEAKGLLKDKIYAQSLFIIILSVAFYFALPFGVFGFAVALLIAQIFRLSIYSIYFIIRLDIKLIDLLKNFIPPVLSAILFTIVLFPLHHFINLLVKDNYLNLVICLSSSAAIYLGVLFLKFNEEIRNKLKDTILMIKMPKS